MREKRRGWIKGLFLFYMVVMTWIILFKMSLSLDGIGDGIRSFNLIPFKGAMIINGRMDILEMIENILIFCPFGIYAGVLWRDWKIKEKVFAFFSVSLIYEILQYILVIGRSDITDLMENTIGGIFGLVIYFLLSKMCRNQEWTEKIILVCASFATAAMTGLIVVIFKVNGF